MNVQIVIDSASDLPKDIQEQYHIESVPLIVHLDDEDYLDGETIESKTVYQAMRDGKSPKQLKQHLTPSKKFLVNM